mmetsp:Transcript_23227/g.48585  ORF Transcript_23227/g.48585 Transcript_23227/m.48585 type:complete len:86 (+) Transcript_23227:381-638(+)
MSKRRQDSDSEKALIAVEEECHPPHMQMSFVPHHAAVIFSSGILSLSSNIVKRHSAQNKTHSKERVGGSLFESNLIRYWKNGTLN